MTVRSGLEAMMLAARAQSFGVWSSKGALKAHLNKEPSIPLQIVVETFLDEAVSHSWNKKVLVEMNDH